MNPPLRTFRRIVAALRAADGKRDMAAELSMIGRTTLYRKIVEREIEPWEWGGNGKGARRKSR